MSPLFWDVMILAIIAFIGFLAIRNIYRDHKNGVPSALVPVQEHRLGVCQMEVRFPSPTYVRFAAVLRQEKNQSLDLTCFSE